MGKAHVALITGSTKGVGREIARKLAGERLAVALNYRSDEKAAAEALEEIRNLCPEAISVRADVSTPEGAARLVDAVLDDLGRLDVLVNNVGPFIWKPFDETTVEEWREMIDGNLSSVFYCTKFALPVLRERGGNVVNIGSLNAEVVRGAPTTAAYNAAKTGMIVLTKSLARTEAKFGIRVNVVNPGFIDRRAMTEDLRVWVTERVPLGRLGDVSDVAEAVAFLISDRADYVTGAVLNVHGGLWV